MPTHGYGSQEPPFPLPGPHLAFQLPLPVDGLPPVSRGCGTKLSCSGALPGFQPPDGGGGEGDCGGGQRGTGCREVTGASWGGGTEGTTDTRKGLLLGAQLQFLKKPLSKGRDKRGRRNACTESSTATLPHTSTFLKRKKEKDSPPPQNAN